MVLVHKFILLSLVICCVLGEEAIGKSVTEARGKGKYALLLHFFYVAATKLFVLKVVYGVIFYVILTKGWHLLIWLIHYLKEKQTPHEHIEFDHHGPIHDHYEPYQDHYEPHHDYYEPQHHYDLHDNFDHHGYYDRIQHLTQDIKPHSVRGPVYSKFNSFKAGIKSVYDADGSYSVSSSGIN